MIPGPKVYLGAGVWVEATAERLTLTAGESVIELDDAALKLFDAYLWLVAGVQQQMADEALDTGRAPE